MPRITPQGHGLGWRPQHPDIRDRKFVQPPPVVLPAFVDLRAKMPPVYDQRQLGSCTANMGAAMLEFIMLKEGLPDFVPSRLFIYYNERVLDGDPSSDTGAQCRDALTVLNKQGACPETEWPYDISQFTVKPSDQCYTDAAKTIATAYLAVDQNVDAVKGAIAAGYPVGFGFTVYQSFEGPDVARTGIMPMPGMMEGVLGGHAVVRVGYYDNSMLPITLENGAVLSPHDSGGYYIVRNSWGIGWGNAGYFYMPYAAESISSDYWILQTVD